MIHNKNKRSFNFILMALLFGGLIQPAAAAWQTPGAGTMQLAEDASQPAPSVTATVREPYYKITALDVGNEVAKQLAQQAVVPNKAEANVNGGSTAILYHADHPLQLVIHALQVDETTKRWQADAYVMAGSRTVTVKPVSGTFSALVDVPVVNRQFGQHDVIAASDLSTRAFPERQLRKDTITDPQQLIGKSPRSSISADRPIRGTELAEPIVIKRGEMVEMSYKTPYMQIKTSGVALEDGSKGSMIRVKNEKSEKAVSARVEDSGRVSVNSNTM